MKLLYLSPGYESHDARFLTEFRAAGWDVQQSSDGLLPFVHDLWTLIQDWKPDVVLADPRHAVSVCLLGVQPYVVMPWGPGDIENIIGLQMVIENAAGVFCDCREVADKIIQYGSPPTIQFPWGIHPEQFATDFAQAFRLGLRREAGWHDKPVLISTRAWDQPHRIDIIVEAFVKARQECPELCLLLLNDGPGHKEIERFLSASAPLNSWHCPGQVDNSEMPNWMTTADLYISATPRDGTSVSMLEAMASYLPIITTDCLGNRDWIVEGTNGWLAQVNSTESLARAIGNAIIARDTWSEIGRVNRQAIEERADWSENFPLLLDFLSEVVG